MLPLILVAASILSGLGGIIASINGGANIAEANKIGKDAEIKIGEFRNKFQQKEIDSKNIAIKLGKDKLDKYNYIKNTFIPFYKRFKNAVSRDDHKSLNNVIDLKLNDEDIKKFENQSINYIQASYGILSSTSTGIASGLGALGLAGIIGSASTGTALSTLSGAAATNATLAWFGGGSLAAGGFGMTGGAVALGSIAIGPALAIGGVMIAVKGEKAMTEAIKYRCDVDNACEKIESAIEILKAIDKRVNEVSYVSNEIYKRFYFHFNNLIKIERKIKFRYIIKHPFRLFNILKGNYFYYEKDLNKKEFLLLTNVRMLAKSLKNILEVPIIDKDGKPSNQSEIIISESKNIIKEI